MGGHCRCSMIVNPDVTIAGLLCQPTVASSNATYVYVQRYQDQDRANVSREIRTLLLRLSSLRCADFGTEEFLGWMLLVVRFGFSPSLIDLGG